MTRIAAFVLIALAIAGFTLQGRLLPRLTAAPHYLGYVEGETTLIAPPIAGRLVARRPQRGDAVTSGEVLFEIDPKAADAEVQRSAAAVVEAEAQLENLRTGKRDVEQEVTRAQRREAEAALAYAEQDLARAGQLVKDGTASRMRFDQASSQVQQLRAKVEQLRAQESVGDLGGRTRELDAAAARVAEAKATQAQAESRRADLSPRAPADALVENTYFDVGEWVGAGQPVLSLLPPGKVKLRFFVPQEHVARARPGASVGFTCDGCGGRQLARVTYVAPRAEYTPPVIYSDSARAKLVFLVEARPEQRLERLRPGLPVEVEALGEVGP